MNRRELYSLPESERFDYLVSIKNKTGTLPPDLVTAYEILDTNRISNLKDDDFNSCKATWCVDHEDFKRISSVMESFQKNELLAEFRRSTPPTSILEKSHIIYKKCISFKEKFTKKIQGNLNFSHETPTICYAKARYCIDDQHVYRFLNRYQLWYGELYPYWNKVYCETSDFFKNSGYDRLGWGFYIHNPESLARKASEVAQLHDIVLRQLHSGIDLLRDIDSEISSIYESSRFEMSLHEREIEISRSYYEDQSNDEEYCYVYILECIDLVFYVGIASDPRARFEQHLRGAFSDESHLFKSKFIQKYKDSVQQKIVYEGTRRECKLFERSYIAEHNPLGNMTQGGEG